MRFISFFENIFPWFSLDLMPFLREFLKIRMLPTWNCRCPRAIMFWQSRGNRIVCVCACNREANTFLASFPRRYLVLLGCCAFGRDLNGLFGGCLKRAALVGHGFSRQSEAIRRASPLLPSSSSSSLLLLSRIKKKAWPPYRRTFSRRRCTCC